MNTFNKSSLLYVFSGSTGSLTKPGTVPNLSFNLFSLSVPYILPFGRTTKSFSTWLLEWWAYGSGRANLFSSVLHIGQTGVFKRVVNGDMVASSCNDSAALISEVPGGGERVVFKPEEGDTYLEWHAGVFKADKPAAKAICSNGLDGSE